MIWGILVGSVSLILVISLGLTHTAHADEGKKEVSLENICMELARDYPVKFESCIVCVNTIGAGPECICESLSDKEMREDGRLENPKQCVKELKHILDQKRVPD